MKRSGGSVLREAFKDTVPVLTGYLVLGMGFGIIMKTEGYGPGFAAAMSIFIYAGSMQYAAIGLFTGGASLIVTALTTLAVNARHLFYGISMLERYRDAGKAKPYLIFALTDETYSLVSGKDKGRAYDLAVSVLDQCYWVAGTLLGSLLGTALKFNTKGIDFALTALFITVFTDQWMSRKDHFPALCGVVLSVLSLVIFGADSFLIPAMVFITAALLLRKGEEAQHE